MKFVLEVDLSGMTAGDEMGKELGRILRYWGSAAKQLEFKSGEGSDIYDSDYRPVGHWAVTGTPHDVPDETP